MLPFLLVTLLLIAARLGDPESACADAPDGAKPRVHATFVHPGFAIQDVTWAETPTTLAFLPDGTLLVGEKQGKVFRVDNGVRQDPPLWDGELEVLGGGDGGLLGIAVDPDFAENLHVYFLYSVDPDTNGVDSDGIGFGRLTRYTMVSAASNALDPASRAVLLGVDRSQGPLMGFGTHTVGALRWGADGTLLVSIGDGASAGAVDDGGSDPHSFGPGKADSSEDIGAYRAQDPASLCGKILRLDPATGHGLPSNPFFDGDPTSDASKVWQLGLRNPFRFAVRPGTGAADPALGQPGSLYIGDVGWLTWEEMNVTSSPGRNFGWPCFEGAGPQPGYQAGEPSHHGCGGLAAPEAPRFTWPRLDSTLSTPPGLYGNCAIGGAFYSGGSYPDDFDGGYWFADYGRKWLKVARMNEANQVVEIVDFARDLDVIDFAVHPVNGDLYVISIIPGFVRRIRYLGPDNARPVAVASSSPTSGSAPLSVAFSSSASYDPDGDPITTHWAFGDGTTSTAPNPTHFYAGGGSFAAILTVQDTLDWVDRDTVWVEVEGPAPMPATTVLDDFQRPNGPIGGLWTGNITALVTRDSAMAQNGAPSPSGVWTGAAFGPDQEAFFTFRTIAPACRRYCLLLKVQGLTFESGGIEVRYDHTLAKVTTSTYTPGPVGWKATGDITGVTFAPGDRFGARAYSDGRLEVFRNQERVGQVMLDEWTLNSLGGRLGVTLAGATGARMDDFGGGTLYDVSENTPPAPTILAPPPILLAAMDEFVRLEGTAFDAEEPEASLRYRWQVDLVHNNHLHPSHFVSTARVDSFLPADHDDGTGVYYVVTLQVTDLGGMSGSVSHAVFPENDPRPERLRWSPLPVGTADSLELEFTLHNGGGAPTPFVSWHALLNDSSIASGSVRVNAHDSVTVQAVAPPGLPAGVHTLRIVVDSLDAVVETDDSNNAIQAVMTIVPGSGPDETPPEFAAAPQAEPLGVSAFVRWTTNEPAVGVVRYGADVLTDSVTTELGTVHEAQIPGLQLSTQYRYRVEVVDPSGNWASSELDSFTTLDPATDVSDGVPAQLALSRAIPNPTRGAMRFGLDLPRAARVRFEIFDLQGRTVWSARASDFAAGRHELRWSGFARDGRVARPGVYVARVDVAGKLLHRRFAMIR